MYNRILKRPMFKRGGPSYQAQGTGITSPFDTPRRQYNVGTSWEEIQENIRRSTADNTTTMQDVAQGFSHLGSPYKDDGSAKTVGEMIFEGSQAVSGSRADRAKTAQAGEIAAQEIAAKQLESQLAKEAAEAAHKYKMEQIAESGKWSVQAAAKSIYNKDYTPGRAIRELTKDIQKNSDDYSFEKQNSFGVAQGFYNITEILEDPATANDQVDIIDGAYWQADKEGRFVGYDETQLTVDTVWWDPKKKKWLVFGDTDNDGYANGQPQEFSVYEDAKEALGKGIKSTSSSEGDSGANAGTIKTEPKGDVDAEGNLKKKVNYSDIGDPTAGQVGDRDDMVATAIDTADQTGKDITDFWKWVSEPKRGKTDQVVKKADGGRIGYMDGSDPQATELNMLNKWWRDQLATTWKE